MVRSIAEDLEALNHQVWFDQKLTGGQPWWNVIIGEIQKCEVFVFALEPDSLESAACITEHTYAVKLGKSILPVLVADVEIELIPPTLALTQYVDYRKQDRSSLRELAKALATLPKSSQLPPPLPEPPSAPDSLLATLKEQVETSEALSHDEQAILFIKLKAHLRDEKDEQHARRLLQEFRMREDLSANVAAEIDEALGRKPTIPSVAHTEIRPSEAVRSDDATFAATPMNGPSYKLDQPIGTSRVAQLRSRTGNDAETSGDAIDPIKHVILLLMGDR